MQYGKKITHESFFGGKIKSTKTVYSIPALVSDKTQTLNEMVKALELIVGKKTHDITIRIEADPKTHVFKLVTTEYAIQDTLNKQ